MVKINMHIGSIQTSIKKEMCRLIGDKDCKGQAVLPSLRLILG